MGRNRHAKQAKPEAGEAKPEAPKPETAKPAKPEAAKPKQAKPEAAKPNQAKPEAAKPKQAKPQAAKPKQAKPEATKQTQAQPDEGKKRKRESGGEESQPKRQAVMRAYAVNLALDPVQLAKALIGETLTGIKEISATQTFGKFRVEFDSAESAKAALEKEKPPSHGFSLHLHKSGDDACELSFSTVGDDKAKAAKRMHHKLVADLGIGATTISTFPSGLQVAFTEESAAMKVFSGGPLTLYESVVLTPKLPMVPVNTPASTKAE